VFQTYYLQLKRAIKVVPHIIPNTLHRFRPFVKFHIERHFIYITACRDKQKVLQSYYKLTEEELKEINKEWPTKLLIPIDPIELSDLELIRSPMITREGNDTPRTSRRKKTEEVQQLSSASEETASDSYEGGGDDEVDTEDKNKK
jgi:hypothetical protein